MGEDLWSINIRRPFGEPKYYKLRGSKSALFGADNLQTAEIALICEGEFDCILASQLIGDVVGAATLGGNTTRLDVLTWGLYLLPLRAILIAFDSEGKSENGLAAIVKKSAQIHPVRVPVLQPGQKDITDYVLEGGDLRAWLNYQLDMLWIPQKPV